MSKKSTTLNNGTDFINVRVEVADECEYLAAALDAGIGAAVHALGHAMPLLIELATPDANSIGTVAMTPATTSVGDATCAVRVRGRINGVPACFANDLFDLIATTVCDATARAMAGPPRLLVIGPISLGEIFSEIIDPIMAAAMSDDPLGYGSTVYGEPSDTYSGGYMHTGRRN